MKVIFDSEKEKEDFCAFRFCPSDYTGNYEDDSCDCYENATEGVKCIECWDKCPVQLEVKSNESNI